MTESLKKLAEKLAESILEKQKKNLAEYRFFTAGDPRSARSIIDARSARSIIDAIKNKKVKNEKS